MSSSGGLRNPNNVANLRTNAPWPKGVSGNPGGRPKDSAVRELAKVHTAEAIETIVQLMRSSRMDNVRLAAAENLLNRAYGKPREAIDINPDDTRDIREYSTDELRGFIAASLARINGEAGSESESPSVRGVHDTQLDAGQDPQGNLPAA